MKFNAHTEKVKEEEKHGEREGGAWKGRGGENGEDKRLSLPYSLLESGSKSKMKPERGHLWKGKVRRGRCHRMGRDEGQQRAVVVCVQTPLWNSLCVFNFVLFKFCQHRLKEIIICLVLQRGHCFRCLWKCISCLRALLALMTSQSPLPYLTAKMHSAGYQQLQAIQTLSKLVFINYCFNNWLIRAAEIQGDLYLKSSSTISGSDNKGR